MSNGYLDELETLNNKGVFSKYKYLNDNCKLIIVVGEIDFDEVEGYASKYLTVKSCRNERVYYHKNLMNLEVYENIEKIVSKRNEAKIIKKNKRCYLKIKGEKKICFDFAFPIVHGKGMEDGTLLAYLKFNKVPVISDSLSFYSLAQNKSLTKRVLNDLNIKNAKFIELYKVEKVGNFSFPLIVKPNNLGSSIGVKKVNNKNELEEALKEAFKYDKKVIVDILQ
jgi:D-alanine-D-alanine ligase